MTSYDRLTHERRLNSALLTCLACGAHIRLPKYKYCNRKCAERFYYGVRNPQPTSCKECNAPFGPLRPSPKSHFCSPACKQAKLRRSWRNYQRRIRHVDLPQDGPPISSEERIQRALNANGYSRRRPKIALPEGWKDVYRPKDDV